MTASRFLSAAPGWLWFAAILAFGLVLLTPFAWMLSTSLKSLDKIFTLPIEWIPTNPQWSNYPSAWRRFPFSHYFLNSLIVSAGITTLTVVFSSLAGYSLAKYRCPGRKWIFIAILATLMLPIEVLMVPTFLIVKDFGWLNTYQGLIIPAIADAFGIFLMRQFMLTIPDALFEAARIDGASELQTFWKIALPLTWPAVLTLSVFTWRESWDSFVWPFLVATDDIVRTVPIGIQRFQSEYLTTYNEVMAISTLAMIPVLLLLLFFQRAFIQGIALSGLKE
jgi:multiple sugar transport system permease protein